MHPSITTLIHSDFFEIKLLEQNILFRPYLRRVPVQNKRTILVQSPVSFQPGELPAVVQLIPKRTKTRRARDVDIAQWYWTYLPFTCTAIDSGCGLIFYFLLFLSFFIVFSDTKNSCTVFISFHSLYAHLPYHKTVLQWLPFKNSASSENLCCSLMLRFQMFSFSVVKSSLTVFFFNFNL